jgi:hypothetical protein
MGLAGVERSAGGALLADVKAVRDGFRAALPRLTEAEAFGAAGSTAPSIRRMQFEAGRHDPVLLVGRTSSTFWLQVSAVYGSLRAVPQIRHNEQRYDSEIDLDAIA